jgi:hypothetical protein
MHTLSQTSNNHALCCTLKHGNTVMQMIDCLLLSFHQLNELFHSLNICFSCNLNKGTWWSIIYNFQTPLREFLYPFGNCFTLQTLPTVNRKYFFMDIICIEAFCPPPQTKHNTMLVYDSTLLKHGRHFDY